MGPGAQVHKRAEEAVRTCAGSPSLVGRQHPGGCAWRGRLCIWGLTAWGCPLALLLQPEFSRPPDGATDRGQGLVERTLRCCRCNGDLWALGIPRWGHAGSSPWKVHLKTRRSMWAPTGPDQERELPGRPVTEALPCCQPLS